MVYEDKVYDELEERLPFDDIETNGERIDKLISAEEAKGEDKLLPYVLANTIAGEILSGNWGTEDNTMSFCDSNTWDSDDFEMNQQFC